MESRERKPRRSRFGNSRDSRDGRAVKERAEREFEKEIEMRLQYFLDSDEKELEFEPMNSFKRRNVHNIAKNYNLESDSRGEEPARYVALLKTPDSEVPSGRKPRLLDFGTQTFPVEPGAKGVRLALKMDGTIELYREQDKNYVLDERNVTSKEIRIRNGKIVQPGDETW